MTKQQRDDLAMAQAKLRNAMAAAVIAKRQADLAFGFAMDCQIHLERVVASANAPTQDED